MSEETRLVNQEVCVVCLRGACTGAGMVKEWSVIFTDGAKFLITQTNKATAQTFSILHYYYQIKINTPTTPNYTRNSSICIMFLLQDDAMSSVTGSSRSSHNNNNNNNNGEDIHQYSFAGEDEHVDDDDMIAIQEEEVFFQQSQQPEFSQQQEQQQHYSPSQRQPPPKVVRRRRRDNTNNNNNAAMMVASSQEINTETVATINTDVLNESSAFSSLQQLLDEPDLSQQQQQQQQQNLSLSMSSQEEDDAKVVSIQTEPTNEMTGGGAIRDEEQAKNAPVATNNNNDDAVLHQAQHYSNDNKHHENHLLDNHKNIPNFSTAMETSNICQQDDQISRSDPVLNTSKIGPNSSSHEPHSASNHISNGASSNDKDQPAGEPLNMDDSEDEPSYMDTIRHRQNDEHEATMARELQRQRNIRERRQQQNSKSHSPIRPKQQQTTQSSRRHREDETSSVRPSSSLRQRLEKQRLGSSSNNRKKQPKTSRSVSADRMTRDKRPSKLNKRRGQSSRSTSPKRSSSRTKPQSVPVQKVKTSIVGHRPSHWGRNTSTTRVPSQRDPLSRLDVSSGSRRSASAEQSQRQRKQLAAACATSNLLMPPPPARRRRNANTENTVVIPHSPIPNLLNISSISFKPDFLPQSHRNTTMDTSGVAGSPMEIDTYDDSASVMAESTAHRTPTPNETSGTANNTNNASFLATVRANNVSRKTGRKRSPHPGEDDNQANNNNRSSAGPLSRLLKQIKSELRIDGTRLRSGEYPFPSNSTGHNSRRFDMCDPRNRATSYMDVTLVGDTLVPWNTPPPMRGRQSTPRNFTILGYIHTHHHYTDRDPRTPTTAGDLDKSPVIATPDHLSRTFAWICLSSDTVQEHNLFNKSTPQGYQLRIYNAITTAIVVADEEEITAATVSNINKCRFSVLCTQLCEPYPTHILGVLQPDMEQLVASLPMM